MRLSILRCATALFGSFLFACSGSTPTDSGPPAATQDGGGDNSTDSGMTEEPPLADSGANGADAASGVDAAEGGSGCAAYPAGPFGLNVGDVVSNFSWTGYAPGASTTSTIQLSDYYDCDGSRGINALLIDVSASWCVPCQDEAPQIEMLLKGTWGKDGVRAVTLLVQDVSGNPATAQTARDWQTQYSPAKVAVGADPNDSFATMAFPTNIAVDPRTMKITDNTMGYDPMAPGDPAIDALVAKNKK
jgi:hypothetical protein